MLTRHGDKKGNRNLAVTLSTKTGLQSIHSLEITRKKWDEKKLYEAVLKIIDGHRRMSNRLLSVESVAYELKAREGAIDKIFMKLNQEGILSQKSRSFAHDTNRNNFFYGHESGWCSNVYVIINEDLLKQKVEQYG